jgi:hypothetical protein
MAITTLYPTSVPQPSGALTREKLPGLEDYVWWVTNNTGYSAGTQLTYKVAQYTLSKRGDNGMPSFSVIDAMVTQLRQETPQEPYEYKDIYRASIPTRRKIVVFDFEPEVLAFDTLEEAMHWCEIRVLMGG